MVEAPKSTIAVYAKVPGLKATQLISVDTRGRDVVRLGDTARFINEGKRSRGKLLVVDLVPLGLRDDPKMTGSVVAIPIK